MRSAKLRLVVVYAFWICCYASSVVTWQLFPRSARPCGALVATIRIFESKLDSIDSATQSLVSNDVLRIVAEDLRLAGFIVEQGKAAESKIAVPVLFGLNGTVEKSFFADAFHPEDGVVLEVEAGRAVDNNQFLKDLFQACMMQDAAHLAICVRNSYRGSNDFEKILKFLDTMYASQRLTLPLKSILLLGY